MVNAEIVRSSPRVATGRPQVVARALAKHYQHGNANLAGMTRWDAARGELVVSAGGMALVFSLTDAPGGNTSVVVAGHFPALHAKMSQAQVDAWRADAVAMLDEVAEDVVFEMAKPGRAGPTLD